MYKYIGIRYIGGTAVLGLLARAGLDGAIPGHRRGAIMLQGCAIFRLQHK
jgi:hypothetical protein